MLWGLKPVKGSKLLCSDQLQVTCTEREVMENWGDSEVREFLLPAEDKVNQCIPGTVNVAGKVDVTQMLVLSNLKF